MKAYERKMEHTLTEADLGAYLRQMANALEGRSVEDFIDLKDGLDGFSKIELKITRKREGLTAKLKVKAAAMPNEAAAPKGLSEAGRADTAEGTRPKYKSLKKRMKPAFKTISASLEKDELPDAQTVNSFIADSELMLLYPGQGDEYYDAYRQALIHFAQAFESGDLASVQQAHARLRQLKDECHERYK